MNMIDLDVLIESFSGIWHPRISVRIESRKKFRQAMNEIDFIDFWKLVEHVKIPCLLFFRDFYEDILPNLSSNVSIKSLEHTLEIGLDSFNEYCWVCNQLGEEPKVFFDRDAVTAQAFHINRLGTLLAYSA